MFNSVVNAFSYICKAYFYIISYRRYFEVLLAYNYMTHS